MKIWTASLALALAGGVTCLLVNERTQRAELARSRSEMAALAETVADSQRSASAVRSEQRTLAQKIEQHQSTVASPKEPVAGPEEELPKGGEETRPPLSPAELHEQIAASHHEETVDPAWSGKARQIVVDGVTAVFADASALRGIDCRSSICRVELKRQDPVKTMELMQRIQKPGDGIWSGAVASGPGEDPVTGEPITISYLFREDHDLPRPQ